MIENYNPTTGLTQEEFEEFAVSFKDLSTTDKVLENLMTRRLNSINGGVNCIPLPFERFKNALPGVEQGQYIVITANQKVTAFII